MDCVFCRIIAGQEDAAQVYADELCVAFMDIYPLSEGHVLLIPRQHVGQLHELDDATRTHMYAVFDRLLAAQRRAGLGEEGTNLLVNDGKLANQHIPHAHMHLIPRRRRDGLRFLYRLFLHITGIFGFARPMEELRAQAARIAAEMEGASPPATEPDVSGLIHGYARTWRLLRDYDEGSLEVPEGVRPAQGVLGLEAAREALDTLAEQLRARGEASDLFARDRGDGLASILGNIEQSMFGESLYKTREERAAHLLYFVIKNHPFSDGNKRSGAFLFLLYLRQEGMRLTLNEQGMTALTLLIAESDPKAKDQMVRLVMHLVTGDASA